MSNYLVNKKIICDKCNGSGKRDFGSTAYLLCFTCKGRGIETVEVDLEEAILELITKSPHKFYIEESRFT